MDRWHAAVLKTRQGTPPDLSRFFLYPKDVEQEVEATPETVAAAFMAVEGRRKFKRSDD